MTLSVRSRRRCSCAPISSCSAPFCGGACRFEPTARSTPSQAIAEHGLVRGSVARRCDASRGVIRSRTPPDRSGAASSVARRAGVGRFMEKRVFLAIFLCFGVLAVYQAYFAPKPPDQAARRRRTGDAPARRRPAPSPTATATPAAAPTAGAAPASSRRGAGARRRHGRARHRRRDRHGARGVLVGRRGAEELAAEEHCRERRRRKTARRLISCRRTCREISPRPFTLAHRRRGVSRRSPRRSISRARLASRSDRRRAR